MSYSWTPWALPGIIIAAFVWPLALFVWRSAPRMRLNRRWAVFLWVVGWINLALQSFPSMAPTDHQVAWHLMGATGNTLLIPVLAAVIAALPGVPQWATGRGWLGLHAGVAVALLVTGLPGARLSMTWLLYVMAAWVLGLFVVCTVLAYVATRAADPTLPSHARARMFFHAFWPYVVGVLAVNAASVFAPTWGRWFVAIVFPVTYAYLVVAISYGIVRHQLFDIDLKLKWTLRRGTVAGAFVALFLIVSLGASEFLVDRFGYVLGAVAAGLLLFALQPLQRFADRMADAAMPNVQNTATYLTQRKAQVYQAALEGMMADGHVTEKEKDVLATLATDLGLAPKDVRAIEKLTQPTT